MINSNLKNKIINGDSLKELKKIPNETFDLIFADPPYGNKDYMELMNICIEKLAKNGKLILEMRNNDFSFAGAIVKHYGHTKIILYTKK